MNITVVYKWLKAQNGEATMEQLVYEFSEENPIEIAEGFSRYMDSQCSGSDRIEDFRSQKKN